jgi:hypothetical protein
MFDAVGYYYLAGLAGFIGVVAGICIAWSLLSNRGRPTGCYSWCLCISSTIVLPSLLLLTESPILISSVQHNEYCGTCHQVMRPYLDDMRSPNSYSLAAMHYRGQYIPSDQCNSCHSPGFGSLSFLFAFADRTYDVWKYYTGTFPLPLRMRGRYSSLFCLKCHGESEQFREIHGGFRDLVYSGENNMHAMSRRCQPGA